MLHPQPATPPPTDSVPATFGHPAVVTFLDWASEKSCYPGAVRLSAICGDLQKPELLGGLIHYVSRSSTLDLLAAWSDESLAISSVHRLGVSVWGSPDPRAVLPAVNPLRRLDESLRGYLSVAPVSAMCSAGHPSVAAHARSWIDTLRTLVLSVSLDYAEVGNTADRHVATVARYLRRACDDPTASDLLKWFLGLGCGAQSLTALSEQLAAQLAGGHRSAPAALVTALRAIALRHPLPDPRVQVRVPLPPVERIDPMPTSGATEDMGIRTELPVGDDDLIALGVSEAQADQTPEQSAEAARGVLIENLEALQYLEYSWQHLHPQELAALTEFVQSRLTSASPVDALLGAFTAVALLTQHSLETVGGVPLASEPASDWSLDLVAGVLRRLPGRRAARWTADHEATNWVRPLAAEWEIPLSSGLASVLREAASHATGATQLSALWRFSESAEQAFNSACRQHPALRRVTSGLVRRSIQTALFKVANDAAFARLATASSRTALPGACAYPAWQVTELEVIWSRCPVLPWVGDIRFGKAEEENALGSELDPLDPLLVSAIQSLHARLVELAEEPARWVEYHNALTGYLIIALLAATGARAIDSPFESPTSFDWTLEFVYIDDKAVDSVESGRPVPLPSELLQMLQQIYLPHLALLAQSLQSAALEVAHELAKLSERRTSKLPFFFFLRSTPFIDWISVSPATLEAQDLVQWPLPWNLMRHRLATQLRRAKVDPEIIDGLLGHSEAGAQTWGDTSLRAWREDASNVRPALRCAFEMLCIGVPPAGRAFDVGSAISEPRQSVFDTRRPVGQEARRVQRTAAHVRAKSQATAELDLAIAGRPLAALSKDELNTLGRSMILTAKGLPRPYADLRYEVFETRVREAWQTEGRRPPLGKRFALARAGSSPFSQLCVGATARRAEVCRILERLAGPSFRPKPLRAAYLAALAICAFDRVTDLRILNAVVRRDDVTLVVRGGRAWLEHRANVHKFPQQPTPRFPICSTAAGWLNIALTARRYNTVESGFPDELGDIASLLLDDAAHQEATGSRVLERLALIVRQVNALELPGVVAAHLDGRVMAWSPPIRDWLRLHAGKALVVPTLEPPGGSDAGAQEAAAAPSAIESRYRFTKPGSPDHGTLEERIDAGRAMLADVRSRLESYAQTTPRGTEDTGVRRDLRREIARMGERHPRAPIAIAMLTAWIYQLLERQSDKPHFLRPSTVVRYLGALANRFLNHAHDLDLAEFDGEELTELYGTMLRAGADEGFDAGYVAQRLRDFHRFAQSEFGLEDPDWGEIGLDSAVAVGAPGIVLEAEYLHAMRCLVPDLRGASRESLCTAMLLLLGFRFGLRGMEAYGLVREDWADQFETLVVLVRSNVVRSLKTTAGRRQVPLLCSLAKHERALVRRFLGTWDEVAQGDTKVPLFAIDRSGARPTLRVMRDRICTALRISCLAPHLTTHHCRHSFASELFLALLPSSLRPALNSARWMDPEHVQRTVLGTSRLTRRRLWALARTVGHTSPATTLRSYVHVLPEVSEIAIATPRERWQLDTSGLQAATMLDGLRPDPKYLPAPQAAQQAALPPPSVSQLVRAAQLLSRGQSAESAASVLAINASVVLQLQGWLAHADERLRRTARSEGSRAARHQRGLLRQILKQRWGRLINIASRTVNLSAQQASLAQTYCQIGPARQVLMWQPDHFRNFAALISDLQLQADVAVYETDDLDPEVQRWADEAGLVKRRRQTDADGARVFQIDGVIDGQPPHRVVSRCAAARATDSVRLRSTQELLILFGCYSISSASLTEESSPTVSNDSAS